jgi:hypothetical protein
LYVPVHFRLFWDWQFHATNQSRTRQPRPSLTAQTYTSALIVPGAESQSRAPEVISNRRLSLSTLSSRPRSPPPSRAQETPISRPRPWSTLALTFLGDDSAVETESFQSTRCVDGFMPEVPVVHIHRRDAIAVGAPLSPNENEFATASTPTRSTSIPVLSQTRTQTQVQARKKENRRFSLSTISNFATSRWDGRLRKRYSVGVGSHESEKDR